MTWPDRKEPGGQAIRTLGLPPKRLVEVDGLMLMLRPRPPEPKPEGDIPF